MRQHVNPLSRFFQSDFVLPRGEDLFENKDLPLHLDIGCARGKFLIDMASSINNYNFLGLEIRESLVIAAEEERINLGLNNLRFLFCNANKSLENLLLNFQYRQLKMVSIQFPDPWFKNRHKKRRLMNDSLLLLLAKNLHKGSALFIQTDVHNLMKDMVDLIDRSNLFKKNQNNSQYFKNPFPFNSEREKLSLIKGVPIYRKLYIRNSLGVFKNTLK